MTFGVYGDLQDLDPDPAVLGMDLLVSLASSPYNYASYIGSISIDCLQGSIWLRMYRPVSDTGWYGRQNQ